MARKTLESSSKRKPEIEEIDLTGDEVLSSLTTNNKKKKIHTPKKTGDSTRKPAHSKKNEKVKFQSPVKRSAKKEEVAPKKAKKSKGEVVVVDERESGAFYAFPMNRVTRIVKSENSDVKLSAEAAFLFNKASEKFLELFSKEAYSRASKDGKKKVEYQHLSSLIPESKRFDFLSDFVPTKVKVADALKEIPSVET